MLTRRQALIGGVTAGALMRSKSSFAKASQPTTTINFDMPADACDCHTHIIGNPAEYPFFSGRVYTPEPALPNEMAALHRALKIKRVVIVTPSVYGTDNAATLFGVKARGADARAVAVIDDKTSDSALDAMGRGGVRGIRLNLATVGTNDPNIARHNFQIAAERMKTRNWHIKIYSSLSVVSGIKDLVSASPVPVIFDHFGGADAAHGLDQPGFIDLLELVGSGKAYVKISGAYRASALAPDYPDVAPLARALIAANPDRIVWGTDWPHPNSVTPAGKLPTDINAFYQIDDGSLLNKLALWAPEAAIRKKILTDNPARLYQF